MSRARLDWTMPHRRGRRGAFDWTSGDERNARADDPPDHRGCCRGRGEDGDRPPSAGNGYAALRWGGANGATASPCPSSHGVFRVRRPRGAGRPAEGEEGRGPPGASRITTPARSGAGAASSDEPARRRGIGVEVREMESHAKTNSCCGGGGGVFLNERAAKLRQGAVPHQDEGSRCDGARHPS